MTVHLHQTHNEPQCGPGVFAFGPCRSAGAIFITKLTQAVRSKDERDRINVDLSASGVP